MQPTADNNGPCRVPCHAGASHPTIERLRSGYTQTIVAYGCSLTAGGAWVGLVSAHLEKMFGDSVRMINSGESRMCSR